MNPLPLNGRVQILIQENTPLGQYNDALYYTEAEWDKLTAQDIVDATKARVDNWVAFVQAQSSKPPYIPTKAELEESATMQADQIISVVTQFVTAKPTKAEAQAIIDKLQESVNNLKTVTAAVI